MGGAGLALPTIPQLSAGDVLSKEVVSKVPWQLGRVPFGTPMGAGVRHNIMFHVHSPHLKECRVPFLEAMQPNAFLDELLE